MYTIPKLAALALLACVPAALASFTNTAGSVRAEGADAQRANPATELENCDGARFQEKRAQMEKGVCDMLWVGDSITDFLETGSGAEVYKKYYERRNPIDLGISGIRTGHVLWQLENAPLDKIHPKMAVVMIGTNNIGHDHSTPAQTVEGIRKIVGKLKASFPEMKILLLEVFPRQANPDEKYRLEVNEINGGLRALYAGDKVENVWLRGIGDLFLNADGTLRADLMPDCLHPSKEGYEVWASAIEPYVIEALGEVPEEMVGKPNDGAEWMERFKEKCDLLRENKRGYQILMLGDSITHYFEKSVFDEQEALTPIWNRYYGDLGAINLAHGGDMTMQLIWRLDRYPLENVHPKLAMVLIGVNNVATDHSYEGTAYATRHVVKELRRHFPEIKVIVLKCLPNMWTGNKKYTRIVNEYNEVLPLYFRDLDYVEVVDISDIFRNEDGYVNLNFLPDRVHPNRDGYLLWGERLKGKVAEKLK